MYSLVVILFAPLESPKSAWHHQQILDTYLSFFTIVNIFCVKPFREASQLQKCKKSPLAKKISDYFTTDSQFFFCVACDI